MRDRKRATVPDVPDEKMHDHKEGMGTCRGGGVIYRGAGAGAGREGRHWPLLGDDAENKKGGGKKGGPVC
jgi:hypothetical protein